MPQTIRCERVNLTLDLLLHRAYGRVGNTPEMLASALALNRGLAASGPHVPLGREVILPDLVRPSRDRPARKAVNLFGD